MSHFTLVLHEKFIGERISDSEHDTVRAEAAALGFHNTGTDHGRMVKFPRGTFVAEDDRKLNIEYLGSRLRGLLNRNLSIIYSDGPSAGFGLLPVTSEPPFPVPGTLLSQIAPLSAPVPPLDALAPTARNAMVPPIPLIRKKIW